MTRQIINVGSAPNDNTGDPVQTAWTKTNANFAELYSLIGPPQGRLTLATGTPVMTASVSGATTIYYSPYVGNKVPIYDGTNMAMTTFAELSTLTTDTTKSPAAIGASKVNDWFVWNDAGTLRLGHGPDWTDDVTRSAGTALVMVNGVLLNNVAITNGPAASRGTYVGTTRSNASSQLDWIYGGAALGGVAGWFGVWNCYNRRRVSTTVQESADSWNVPASTIRQLNNSANNRVSFVTGLQEDAVDAFVLNVSSTGFSGGAPHGVGIGYDSTTVLSGITQSAYSSPGQGSSGRFATQPVLGFHFLAALEVNGDSSSVTYYGDAGFPLYASSGLMVSLWM